jgi:hypothetical protein
MWRNPVVAAAIASDPGTYTEAVLGRPHEAYLAWIQQPNSWGGTSAWHKVTQGGARAKRVFSHLTQGAIELAILARLLDCALWAYDIQTVRVNRFGTRAQ